MARITVEDCLQAVDNRFELVMVASKRAHALATGGKTALVAEEGDKPTVIALRELAEGKITREQVMAANKHDDDEPEIDLAAELGAASL